MPTPARASRRETREVCSGEGQCEAKPCRLCEHCNTNTGECESDCNLCQTCTGGRCVDKTCGACQRCDLATGNCGACSTGGATCQCRTTTVGASICVDVTDYYCDVLGCSQTGCTAGGVCLPAGSLDCSPSPQAQPCAETC
jgi:hypothetical protein